jgi:hypothetical protein
MVGSLVRRTACGLPETFLLRVLHRVNDGLKWECSHVDCPNRRSVMVLDGFEPTGPAIGRRTKGKVVVDVGIGGCFRRRPSACSYR